MDNKTDSIGRYFSMLHRYAKVYIDKKVEPFNIGSGQFIYLIYLYKNPGIRQEDLAKHFRVDKGTAARAVKKLENEGYVERKTDPEDQRAYQLFITEKGKEIRDKVIEILQQWSDILWLDFTPEEKKQMFGFVERMAENAKMAKRQNGIS
jgi:DNA-binding MarR family transcriptional regulator